MSKVAAWMFECPKSRDTIHAWKRNEDQTAICITCGKQLTEEEANDCWRERT